MVVGRGAVVLVVVVTGVAEVVVAGALVDVDVDDVGMLVELDELVEVEVDVVVLVELVEVLVDVDVDDVELVVELVEVLVLVVVPPGLNLSK